MSKIWYPTARVQLVLRVDDIEDLKSFRDPKTNVQLNVGGKIPLSATERQNALAENQAKINDIIGSKDFTPPNIFETSLADARAEREEIYSTASVSTAGDKGLATDPKIVKFWVLPRRVRIEKNNISDAGKCTVELEYRSIPFDPRAFRFAAVRVVVGSASPEDYEAGILSGGSQSTLPSIVPPEETEWYSLTGNSRFVGFVDEWTVEFDDVGEKVTLQCRDISAVIRDEEISLSEGIDLDKPIREGVEELLRKEGPSSMRDIRVVFGNPVYPLKFNAITDILETIGGPVPRGAVENVTADLTAKERALQQVISANGLKLNVRRESRSKKAGDSPTKKELADATTDTSKNPPEAQKVGVILPPREDGLYDEDTVKKASKLLSGEKKKPRKKKAAKNKSNMNQKVWDHILDTCLKIGLIPIMRGNILYIASPRDVFSGLYGRRQMIWGGNISKLRLSRKAGSSDATGKTIQMLSSNPRLGGTVWARYPVSPDTPASGILGKQGSPQPVNTRAVQANASKEPEEKIITFSTSGVWDEKRLREIAEAVYHRVARQEIAVSLETEDLSSFSFDRRPEPAEEMGLESGDLLAIQSGDAIIVDTIRTANQVQANTLTKGGSYLPNNFLDISAMSYGERVNHFESIGFNSQVAEALAGGQEFGDLQRTFRVNHASLAWDSETGVKISLDAVNFIEARLDMLGDDAEESGP
jgi:hypothetical protein